jgi:hypothetical protein
MKNFVLTLIPFLRGLRVLNYWILQTLGVSFISKRYGGQKTGVPEYKIHRFKGLYYSTIQLSKISVFALQDITS